MLLGGASNFFPIQKTIILFYFSKQIVKFSKINACSSKKKNMLPKSSFFFFSLYIYIKRDYPFWIKHHKYLITKILFTLILVKKKMLNYPTFNYKVSLKIFRKMWSKFIYGLEMDWSGKLIPCDFLVRNLQARKKRKKRK